MSGTRTAKVEDSIVAAIASLGLDRPSIRELAGGVANRSFRLRDARQDVVLRLAGDTTPGLGANRASELAIQGIAAGAGLAPEILLDNRDLDFIVTRHAGGRVPSRAEMRQSPMLRRVGAWIADLHALAPPTGLPVVDIGERAAGYLSRLLMQNGGPEITILSRALDRRRAMLPPPSQLACCHHDLHHLNFVDTGDKLLAVDWEYAGPGDPAADIACCIGYHELDTTQAGYLLEAYGSETPIFRERVAALGWIFDCLWYGWNAVAALEGLDVDPGLQGRLAARLAG
jgi:aminoglycoside phosphotransferase (APT) family kinase protein